MQTLIFINLIKLSFRLPYLWAGLFRVVKHKQQHRGPNDGRQRRRQRQPRRQLHAVLGRLHRRCLRPDLDSRCCRRFAFIWVSEHIHPKH